MRNNWVKREFPRCWEGEKDGVMDRYLKYESVICINTFMKCQNIFFVLKDI
jgi:hypothetical protein